MLTYWVVGENHPRRKNSVYSAVDTSPCTQYRDHSPYLSRSNKRLQSPSSPKLRYRHSIDTMGLLLPVYSDNKLQHGSSSTKQLLNNSNCSNVLSPDDSLDGDAANCDINTHDNYVAKLNKANTRNTGTNNNNNPHRRAASVRIRFNDEPMCNKHQEMIRSTSKLQDTIWEKGGEVDDINRQASPEFTPLLTNKENCVQMNHVGSCQRPNRARECEV